MSVPARKGGAVGRFYQFGEDAGGCVGCSPVSVELSSASFTDLVLCLFMGVCCVLYVREEMVDRSKFI